VSCPLAVYLCCTRPCVEQVASGAHAVLLDFARRQSSLTTGLLVPHRTRPSKMICFVLVAMVKPAFGEQIEGWFGGQKTTALLMAKLEHHNHRGAVAEIGVHHGKSFIHLLQQATSERPFVAIDVFENQGQNMDGSGRGDHAIFKGNIRRNVRPWQAKLVSIMNSSSLEVTVADIMGNTRGQRVALFSVDGCHTFDCTLTDLRTAYDSLTDYGIIMVDDYGNTAWPGVANAVGAFLEAKRNDVAAIAYGENKYYIVKLNAAGFWMEVFRERCKGSTLCNRAYCDRICVLHEHCTHYNPVTQGHLVEIR